MGCLIKSTLLGVLLAMAAGLAAENVLAGGTAMRRTDTPQLPQQMHDYLSVLPPHLYSLEKIDNTPASNPLTNAGATLGRVLFHDHQLSRNGLVACASCHTQTTGFDDSTRLSIGFAGKITRRSAMALANARYNPAGRYFRDERAATLEEQVLDPFTDAIEMGLQPGELVSAVAARSFYPPLFAAAFGNSDISEPRIAAALAQYVRAIVSTHSPYDAGRAGVSDPRQDFVSFSASENHGKRLFLLPREQGGAGCAACHATEAFVLLEPKNNGLETKTRTVDDGIGETTKNPSDLGKFRTASLRNIAATAPYMHDGRFATLAAVIEHYASNVQPHPNLSVELKAKNGEPARLDFKPCDKQALVDFLTALTDAQLLADPRFGDPFVAR